MNDNNINQEVQNVNVEPPIQQQQPPIIENVKPKTSFNPIAFIVIIVIVAVIGFGVYKYLSKPSSSPSTINQNQETKGYKKVYENQPIGTQTPVVYSDKDYHTTLGAVVNATYTIEVYDEELGDITDVNNGYFETIYREISSGFSDAIFEYITSLGPSVSMQDIQANIDDYDFAEGINTRLKVYHREKMVKITKVTIMGIDYAEESKKLIDQYNNQSSDNTKGLFNEFGADIRLYSPEEGGRHTAAFEGARWYYKIGDSDSEILGVIKSIEGSTMMNPGEDYSVVVNVSLTELSVGDTFKIIDGENVIGEGTITAVNQFTANN